MLVCNVSMRAPRRAIAADLVEIATAADASTTGNVIFAALVDDPASVADTVDAYLGEIMVEAASAADSIVVGLIYDADVVAAVTAIDVPDAVATTPPAFTTWNPSDKSANITLSNSDLTAVSTSASGGLGGVRGIAGRSSGKYYFEVTMTTITSSALGLALSSNPLAGASTAGAVGVNAGGTVVINGGFDFAWSLPGLGGGLVFCVAADLTNNLIWFRVGPSGSWNATSGSANNPATGTGGINMSAIAGTRYPWFITATGSENVTANFGATAFSGAVPSGFTPGW